MPTLSFANLLIVVAAAFTLPLLAGFVPSLRLPSAVLELLAGIAIGPSGLGLVTIDPPIQVLALIGLAFLLFLAGVEISFDQLGSVLRPAALNFLLTATIALALSYGFAAAGLITSPLLIGITLAATALGIVVAVLKDANQVHSTFGQLVIAGASLADFGTVILLSLFFSRTSSGVGAQLVLVGGVVVLAVVLTLALLRAERWQTLGIVLEQLENTTAQIRIRGAFALLVGFAALAQWLGLEVILGAFIAGAVLSLLDHEHATAQTGVRHQLNAIGYGIFIPVFFITSGMQLDLRALFASSMSLAQLPLFLAALLVIHMLPALLYRRRLGNRQALAAGLLQATSLSFVVAAVQIGRALGILTATTGAALIAAGLLSVLLFPLAALLVLGKKEQDNRMDMKVLQSQPATDA